MLEVSGFYGQSPIFRFCYRINQVLNVADEKLNTEQLREALDMFRRRTGRRRAAFCAQEDFSVRPGRYLVYVEAPPLENAAQIMDECLGRASFAYQSCRSMGDIGPARVRFLPPGSFQRYEAALARRGRAMAQYKPVEVLRREEERRFFTAEADEYEGRGEP